MVEKSIYHVRWDTLLNAMKSAAGDNPDFNIHRWVGRRGDYHCGTGRCAIGWACNDRQVQALGLTLERHYDEGSLRPIFRKGLGSGMYTTYLDFEALLVWLGLPLDNNGRVYTDDASHEVVCCFSTTGYGDAGDPGVNPTFEEVIARAEQVGEKYRDRFGVTELEMVR